MKNKPVLVVGAAVLAMCTLTGFGLGDLTGKVQEKVTGEDCSKAADKKKCQTNSAVKGAAIGVAAEAIRQMVIEFSTTRVASQKDVVEKYKVKNKELPEKTTVAFYNTTAAPGLVVKSGNKVAIDTTFEVIPGRKEAKNILIEENISIHDNEDNSKVLNSLTKAVNDPGKKAGSFKNEFKFTMPVGLPQGVYPITTTLLVNKQEMKHGKNDIQLVLRVLNDNSMQIATLAY